jgi:hypothetical protein
MLTVFGKIGENSYISKDFGPYTVNELGGANGLPNLFLGTSPLESLDSRTECI